MISSASADADAMDAMDELLAAEWAAGVAEILADPADLERKHAAGLDLERAYDRFLRRHPRGAGA